VPELLDRMDDLPQALPHGDASPQNLLVPAFVEGLAAGGLQATPGQVDFGYMASLVVRAGFTSLPFERLDEPATPALAATFRERAALTRFIADLGLSLP
jgi:hypothetical protein